MILSETELRHMAGSGADADNLRSVVVSLNRFGPALGLGKPHRLVELLSNLAVESGWFRYDREIWGPTTTQKRYEDRTDLGHSTAVDGEAFKFRGHGPIQVTGRYNHRKFTEWSRRMFPGIAVPDFEATPEAINTDPWEGLSPLWYWAEGNPTGKSLNVYADAHNSEAVRRKINGGLNGYVELLERIWPRVALALLGYELVPGAVRRFQLDAGFSSKKADDIPGSQTRGAMFNALVNLPERGAGASQPDDQGPGPVANPEKPVNDTNVEPRRTGFWEAVAGFFKAVGNLLRRRKVR